MPADTSTARSVVMDAEQVSIIEEVVVEMMRRQDNDDAKSMMKLVLAYRFAAPLEPAHSRVSEAAGLTLIYGGHGA